MFFSLAFRGYKLRIAGYKKLTTPSRDFESNGGLTFDQVLGGLAHYREKEFMLKRSGVIGIAWQTMLLNKYQPWEEELKLALDRLQVEYI